MLQGIVKDKGEPIIFGSVAVFRNGVLLRGVETDLEGEYSILCQIGDAIEASYVGYTPQRFVVTASMFDESENIVTIKVEPVRSNAYHELASKRKDAWEDNCISPVIPLDGTIQVDHPYKKYGAIGINIKDNRLSFVKEKKQHNYSIDVHHALGVSYVQNRNLPRLQSQYAQGRPIGGVVVQQDFTNGEQFSWGPMIAGRTSDNNLIRSSTFENTSLKLDFMRGDTRKYMTLFHQRDSDIFGAAVQRSASAKVGIARYIERSRYFAAELSFSAEKIGNHNATGYYQNVLKSMMVQSPSFDSSTKMDGDYVSFAPAYNNPRWILENNSSAVSRRSVGVFLQHRSYGYEESNYSNSLKLELNVVDVDEHFAPQTVGKSHGLIRNFEYLNSKALLVSTFEKPINDYRDPIFYLSNFLEAEHLRFRNSVTADDDYGSALVRSSPRVGIKSKSGNFKFDFGYIPILSTLQKTEWASTDIDLNYQFDIDKKFLDAFVIMTTYERKARNQELYLSNNAYSAQTNNSYDALGSAFDLPLFLGDNLDNEVAETAKLGISLINRYKGTYLETSAVYGRLRQRDVVFPMQEADAFVLRNAGSFNTNTIEWRSHIKWRDRKGKLNFVGKLNVVRYTTHVTRVNQGMAIISGFADVSKQMIKGQPVGVIVGSDYKRNEDGLMIIGKDGFPILSEENTIIGDPTPWFVAEGSSKLEKGRCQIVIHLDGQLGGKIWNGTQQALDYHGVSQSTAEQREEESFVYEGVDESGQINTVPVSFADPSLGVDGNKWTRYGREGVAADYISDASYLRVKRLAVGYRKDWFNGKEVQIHLFATNVFTLAPFRGFTTNFLFEDDLSGGLQYFNQPMSSQVGISTHFKL